MYAHSWVGGAWIGVGFCTFPGERGNLGLCLLIVVPSRFITQTQQQMEAGRAARMDPMDMVDSHNQRMRDEAPPPPTAPPPQQHRYADSGANRLSLCTSADEVVVSGRGIGS